LKTMIEISSHLGFDRSTRTPVQVLQLARATCERIHLDVPGQIRRAGIFPLEDRLSVFLEAGENQEICLSLIFGRGYDIAGTLENLRAGKKSCGVNPGGHGQRREVGPLIQYPVPDALEALHLAGIVLDALDPAALEVGYRGREMNEDLWRDAPGAGRNFAPMDLCDHIHDGLADQNHQHRLPSAILWSDRTYTPVGMFTLAARAANAVRRSLSSVDLRAVIWGCRLDQALSVSDDSIASSSPGKPCPLLVMVIYDDQGDSYRLNFRHADGRAYALQNAVKVPNMMSALHMAGIIVDALGARVESVGSRRRELNEAVQEGPPGSGERGRRIACALNFVMPLAPA
jgi:hypothetical protein